MQMPRGSGLEVLDKIVRSSLKYYADTLKIDSIRKNILDSVKRYPSFDLPSLNSLKQPVESLINGLNNTFTQLTAKPARVDYDAVVNSFLPPGTKLLKPQFPENSNEIQFADLDGDSSNELIASYRSNEGVKTVVLKKDEVQWYKMAEISNPEFEGMHYRNSVNMAGDGKKYLLLGLTSKLQANTLFAYSLDDGNARKMFSRKYGKLELQKSRSTAGASPKDSLALWNEEAPDIYDIELVHWNGFELEQLDNTRYLAGKVVPYYIRKLRMNSDDPACWYNLANALSKTGNSVNAATAVNLGLERNPDVQLKDRFNTLKSRL